MILMIALEQLLSAQGGFTDDAEVRRRRNVGGGGARWIGNSELKLKSDLQQCVAKSISFFGDVSTV